MADINLQRIRRALAKLFDSRMEMSDYSGRRVDEVQQKHLPLWDTDGDEGA